MPNSEADFPAQRWWLHVLLLLLTFVSTTCFGFALTRSFRYLRPLDDVLLLNSYQTLFSGNHRIWSGALYSLPVLLILVAHEMGHYVACRRTRVAASLPYFLPSPFLLGTFGAFIRIPTPIYSRRNLFDIGVSGPIAGAVVLLPFLVAGVWMSRVVVPVLHSPESLVFGTPLLMRAVELVRFPGTAPQNIAVHPVAMAAWAGLLATSLNLLPVGQLDGGHIVYAVGGQRMHKRVSIATIGALALMGFICHAWWVWGVLLFFFRHHPLVYDQAPLGRKRLAIGGTALGLLLLSLALVPVDTISR